MKKKILSVAVPPFGVEVPIDDTNHIVTHSETKCVGQWCVIHNPSNHHMKDWPINLRLDRFGALAERICPHGTGHPDPDSLAYVESLHKPEDRGYEGVHGCDGCCQTIEEQVDLIERILHPEGRCMVCGGGKPYWKHDSSRTTKEYHAFVPEKEVGAD